jgi:pimeloyl-ACP methyl ester carboxylesterase
MACWLSLWALGVIPLTSSADVGASSSSPQSCCFAPAPPRGLSRLGSGHATDLRAAVNDHVARSAAAAGDLKPCRVKGLRHEVRCGWVRRALNASQPHGTAIDVHYVLVPALARHKLADPVFLLAGGPGQSAVSLASTAMSLFSRLNNRRDIVLVDQRGTGRSAPLMCDETHAASLAQLLDDSERLKALRACRQQLQKRPNGDLRHYTTTEAMQDLDAVRRALGVEQINLVGASYGTRAGLEYLRLFPHAVRRLVLDGVVPPDMVLPASFSTDSQAVLEALFKRCESDAACFRVYPHLRDDWATLLKSLPRVVDVLHPLTGQPERLTLTRSAVLQAVRMPLYVPSFAVALPQAVADAAQGRLQALVGLMAMGGGGSRSESRIAQGMHFSVVCAEDVPKLGKTRDLPGADFGRDAAAFYQAACQDWPRGEVPAGFDHIAKSPAPVLLMSGSADPATPPRHGERVTQALGAKARHVLVPNWGHGVMSVGCMRDVVFRFVDAADDAAALQTPAECAKNIPSPPFSIPIKAASVQGSKP